MKAFLSEIFSADIRIRAALLMALFIMVFWWCLGKLIIRFASYFPYLLKRVFRWVYLLIETPVCWLHGKAGAFFYQIDNGVSGVGRKIDSFLEQWHECWKNPKNRHIFLSIVIYGVFLAWICIPYQAKGTDFNAFNGQEMYLKVESKLKDWLKSNNLYEEPIKETTNYGNRAGKESVTEGIVMKVITEKTPLTIRDIPSAEKCEILERIAKESTVIWRGDIAFGSVRNGGIEPWIKVETASGTEGWARLIYLCPINKKDFKLKLQ